LRGKRLIQVFLIALTDPFIQREFTAYFASQNGQEGRPLTHLMIMHNKYKKLFNLNHELIVLDFTYKINRFNMFLLNVVGIAPINKFFFGVSCFLFGKINENFAWYFERLKLNCYLRGIPSPKIFFMDADPAQIRAFKQVFPDAVILLCVWHVNEKIYAKLKSLFKAEMENAEDAENMEIAAFLERKWKL
jgi:hypothetical protein